MSRRTIQSPGVEIREIDLTQRPAAPVGTSVFIAGFANQGPVDEIFNVGTFAEFEEIYGKPTNAAERYFYHSTKQIFNSDANVLVSRLPYGTGDGTSTEKYSALVYPVIDANVGTISGESTGKVGSSSGLRVEPNITGDAPFVAEIVSQSSNGDVRYTSLSTGASYIGGTAVLTTSDPDFTKFQAISGDTLISGVFLSGGTVDSTADDIGTLGAPALLDSDSQYYIFGNPSQVELTRAQYISATEGNFTFSSTGYISGATAAARNYTPANIGNSGLVIFNKSKLTTNNSYEGYYAAVTDQSQMTPSGNFNSVGSLKATTSTGNKNAHGGTFTDWTTVPSTRIDFALSGSSTDEKSNTSKTLENISKFDLDGGEFIDTLSIGIFKVRITPFANSELELTSFLSEGYAGSLNSFRKIQNENGGDRKSFFIEELADNSNDIKIMVNPKLSTDNGDWTSTKGDAPTKFVRHYRKTDITNAAILAKVQSVLPTSQDELLNGFFDDPSLTSLGVYQDTNNNSTKKIGNVPTKLDRVFNIASNVDLVNIDVSVEAGLGSVYAIGSTQSGDVYTDTSFVDVSGTAGGFYTTNDGMDADDADQITLRDNYRTIFNKFETFARQTRKDHIFIADVLKPLVVQGKGIKALDNKDKSFSQHVYWPLRHQFGTANSNFATVYGNWAKVYDGTSDSQIWIPFSGVAAKIYANNDANFAPWFAPAGFNRGVVTGVNDIAISPTQRQRDQLYRIAVNPVTQFPAEGIVVFGQKTLQRKPTAFDRVNVRRLFLDLEKRTRETLKFFVFEPNTFLTRNRVVNTLTPIFENAKQTEGVYDYLIVCDDRNNPASVIDQNELRVDIYLKPVRAAEFILVNFFAVNTDVNFEEIVGQ